MKFDLSLVPKRAAQLKIGYKNYLNPNLASTIRLALIKPFVGWIRHCTCFRGRINSFLASVLFWSLFKILKLRSPYEATLVHPCILIAIKTERIARKRKGYLIFDFFKD